MFSNFGKTLFAVAAGALASLAGTATAFKLASAWDSRYRSVDLRFVGLKLDNLNSLYGDAIRVREIAAGNRLLFESLGIPQCIVDDEGMAAGMLAVQGDLGEKVEGPSGATLNYVLNTENAQPSASRLVVCLLSGGNVSRFPKKEPA